MTADAPAVGLLDGAGDLLTIASDVWQVDVLPGTGAALAAGRVRTDDGVWRDLLRPTHPRGAGNPEKTSSWPMVPWANRISGGLLRFGGRSWQLQRNGADLSAIHGATRNVAWPVVDRTEGAVALELDTRALVGVNFPWHFVARVEYRLDGAELAVTTSLRNVADEAFPAGFGHHPYFRRALVPVGATPPTRSPGPVLEIPAHRGWRMHDGLVRGPAREPRAVADFRTAREVGAVVLDDVLTDLEPGAPVRLHYPELTAELRLDATYTHLVVYSPRGRSYLAVEPQTQVTDAYALFAEGAADTGTVVLAPGEELTGRFTITIAAGGIRPFTQS